MEILWIVNWTDRDKNIFKLKIEKTTNIESKQNPTSSLENCPGLKPY